MLNSDKSVAVLQNYAQYKEKEDLLDAFEDLILGYLAKERFDRSTAKDYVDGAVVAKKLGIRFHTLVLRKDFKNLSRDVQRKIVRR